MGKKGFTLLELLIVIVIIGVLAAIGIPRYVGAIAKARKTEARATLTELRKVQQAYYSAFGSYAVVGTAGNLAVDLDGDGTPDLNWLNPESPTFDYSASVTEGLAATKIGGLSYELVNETGAFSSF